MKTDVCLKFHYLIFTFSDKYSSFTKRINTVDENQMDQNVLIRKTIKFGYDILLCSPKYRIELQLFLRINVNIFWITCGIFKTYLLRDAVILTIDQQRKNMQSLTSFIMYLLSIMYNICCDKKFICILSDVL